MTEETNDYRIQLLEQELAALQTDKDNYGAQRDALENAEANVDAEIERVKASIDELRGGDSKVTEVDAVILPAPEGDVERSEQTQSDG